MFAACTGTWRVALFRFWILGAVLFVIGVASISYTHLERGFDAAALQDRVGRLGVVLPQLCRNARGVAGLDYSTQKGREPGPWDVSRNVNASELCWYAGATFRRLYPEFDKLSNKDLVQKLYAEVGEPIHIVPDPWARLWTTAIIAFGIPLLVLALGAFLLSSRSVFSSRQF